MGSLVPTGLAAALIAAISVSGSQAAEKKKEQAPSPASISSRLFSYSFFQMNTLAEVPRTPGRKPDWKNE